VIPTYQRPALLERVLDALAAQTLAPDEFEIIVCDDAQSDVTREVVDRWRLSHDVPIAYVVGSAPGQGPAAMRNAGWRFARGEVIAFTDDDTIPDRDWLWQGLLALDAAAADAASGRIVVPLPEHPTDSERAAAARLEGAGFVTTNCFCLRRALECVRGFDTRLRGARRTVTDFFSELIKYGFDVVHAIDAVVVHPVRPATWEWSLRAEAKRVFDALALTMVLMARRLRETTRQTARVRGLHHR
jgi:glycosyltransferase involved in cell wall biosynthesis